MLCCRRLVDDDQAAQLTIFASRLCSSRAKAAGDFLTPERSPILSLSACLAENPGALKLENPRFYARNARKRSNKPCETFERFHTSQNINRAKPASGYCGR